MVATCCFGQSTAKTGAGIISLLSIVGSILEIVVFSVLANHMITNPENISEQQYPEFQKYGSLYIASQFVGILFALIYGILSGILFEGYRTENVRLCTPWLYWNFVFLTIASVITVCGLVAEFVILGYTKFLVLSLSVAFIIPVSLGIQTYCTLVVQRFVNEMRDGRYNALRSEPDIIETENGLDDVQTSTEQDV